MQPIQLPLDYRPPESNDTSLIRRAYHKIESLLRDDPRRELRIAIHDGSFHSDDVLCVALIKKTIIDYERATSYNRKRKMKIRSCKLFRTRSESLLRRSHLVLDVGCEDRITPIQVRFDHHQKDPFPDTYPNGVKMATCGKLARWLYQDLDPDYYEFLKDHLLYTVEAIDNGQNLEELDIKLPANYLSFIPLFNPRVYELDYITHPIWMEEEMDFQDAVNITIRILERLDAAYYQSKKDTATLSKALEKYDGKGHLKLDTHVAMQLLIEENNRRILEGKEETKIMLVSFPHSSGNKYMLQAVVKGIGTFDSWIKLPKEWRGLRGADLNVSSGTMGGVFVHNSGFLGAWDNYEAILTAVKATLKAMAVE